MASLILTADCAYPFDYSRLPRGVKVILGYLGDVNGTPNVWAQSDIDTARATGRGWLPIWTPPGAVLNRQLGLQAANGMLAAIAARSGLAGCPVFLDIEQHVYAADPAGARDAWGAWQATMRDAGHSQAWPYLPWAAGYGWAANWTGQRPRTLPAGLIGWQYEGHVDADRYDLSVMAPAVLAGWTTSKGGAVMPLSTDDKAFIVEQLTRVQAHLVNHLHGFYGDAWPDHPHPAALVHLRADIAHLAQLAGQGSGQPVDVQALAAQLATDLGPALSAQLADELARRLAK